MKLDIGAGLAGVRTREDTQLGRRHSEWPPPAKGIVQPHRRFAEEGIVGLVQGPGAGNLENRALLKVVLKIGADAGQDAFGCDACVREHRCGANPGALKDHRAADSAGAQDDFCLGRGRKSLAILLEHDTRRAPVFEADGLNECLRLKPDVPPAQGGLQKAPRGRPAAPRFLVHMKVSRAFIVSGVEIRNFRNADLFGRVADRIENVPSDAGRLDAPFAAHAVKRAVAQEVILHLPEYGQDIIPAPSGQSAVPPAIIVSRLSPHRDHGVYRRRPTDDLAARIGKAPAIQAGLLYCLIHPVASRIANGKEVADRDIMPDPVVLPACFE